MSCQILNKTTHPYSYGNVTYVFLIFQVGLKIALLHRQGSHIVGRNPTAHVCAMKSSRLFASCLQAHPQIKTFLKPLMQEAQSLAT